MIEGSENWEVGPCFDPTGRHVTSWDIWVKPESDAIGVAVIASVYSGEVVAREILAAIQATRPPIVTVERVKLEFYRDYPLSVGYGLSENGRDYAVRDEHFRAAADEFADRLIAAMPTIDQDGGEA